MIKCTLIILLHFCAFKTKQKFAWAQWTLSADCLISFMQQSRLLQRFAVVLGIVAIYSSFG